MGPNPNGSPKLLQPRAMKDTQVSLGSVGPLIWRFLGNPKVGKNTFSVEPTLDDAI